MIGLLVLLGETPRAQWRWWRVDADAIGGLGGGLGDGLGDGSSLSREHSFTPGEAPPWGPLAEDARVVVLVPAERAPVRSAPRPDMPLAQALAAARLDPPGRIAAAGEDVHVAVAAPGDETRILSSVIARAEMDLWLAELAAEGLGDAVLLPTALILPEPGAEAGAALVTTILGEMPLARSRDAAFAGEPELLAALAAGSEIERIEGNALRDLLFAAWQRPPLDLRQGVYARRRTTFFRLPDWRQLGRMAALLALLVLAVLLVETIKLNRSAAVHEERALAAARERFPEIANLASAKARIDAALVRAGAEGARFADSAPAVFAAMQPQPSVRLRSLAWSADGTLSLRAAAPDPDAINAMLINLQRDGWEITVPPELAPDPGGAIVADITVRAP